MSVTAFSHTGHKITTASLRDHKLRHEPIPALPHTTTPLHALLTRPESRWCWWVIRSRRPCSATKTHSP